MHLFIYLLAYLFIAVPAVSRRQGRARPAGAASRVRSAPRSRVRGGGLGEKKKPKKGEKVPVRGAGPAEPLCAAPPTPPAPRLAALARKRVGKADTTPPPKN